MLSGHWTIPRLMMLTYIGQSDIEQSSTPIEDDVLRPKATAYPASATPGSGGALLRAHGGMVTPDAANAPAEVLPNRCFSPGRKYSVFPKKRKIVLPLVDPGRMTTVQEACQDSRETCDSISTAMSTNAL